MNIKLNPTPTIIICAIGALVFVGGLFRGDDGGPATAEAAYGTDDGSDTSADGYDYGSGDTDSDSTDSTDVGAAVADETADESAPEDDLGFDPDGPLITIASFAYGDPLTVAPGETVNVVNTDGSGHTVTANDGEFGTDRFGKDQGGTFVAPAEAGTYTFFCEIHPSMAGELVVSG